MHQLNYANNILRSNPLCQSLYGVGLSYQLYEMQQVYRHPRKIYKIALNLSNNQSLNNSINSSVGNNNFNKTIGGASTNNNIANNTKQATDHEATINFN